MVSNESQTQKLIGLYRSCECLWNPQSPGYQSGSVQEDAWRRITREMNSGLTPDQVKLQVLALRNYYDAECAAIRKSNLEGYSHTPRHSYFLDLLFLGNVLSEKTAESKASFCLSQLSGILEDSLTQDNYKPSNYPHNFSKATFSQCTDSLCNRDQDSEPDYTYYKLVLEPEKPSAREMENGAVMGKPNERSASGNDNARFYPTTYCESCTKKKPSYNPRCQFNDTESSSSMESDGPRRAMHLDAHNCCSCVSLGESHVPSQTFESPPVGCRHADSGQPRPKYFPRCPPLNTDRDKFGCESNWRLEAQNTRNKSYHLTRERQRVQLPPLEDRNSECYCKSQECLDGQEGQILTCYCNSDKRFQNQVAVHSNERRQSGADQMNACSQPGIPQNCYQSPITVNCTNDNQQDLDYGRYGVDCRNGPEPGNYCHGQQSPDSDNYINNQQMQNQGRFSNDPQGQQVYSNGMYFQLHTPNAAYYQPHQQYARNMVQPPNLTRPAQQYVNYVPFQPGIDYGRPAVPDQSNAYYYAGENCNCPPQSTSPLPAQKPLTVCAPPQDVQNSQAPCHDTCQASCAVSGLPDLYNRSPADTCRYTEQSPVLGVTNGQQENRVKYSDTEQDTQRRSNNGCQDLGQKKQVFRKDDMVNKETQNSKSNDCDQDENQIQVVCRKVDRTRSSDYIEDTVRSRGLYNESPNRRGYRNNGTENNYEECLPGTRQYAAERDVCCSDCNYEKCPAQRRRRSDDCDEYFETPTRRNPDIQGSRRTDQTIFSRKPSPEFRKKPKRKEYVECPNQNSDTSKVSTQSYKGAKEPKAGPVYTDDAPCLCAPLCQIRKESPDDCEPNREDRIAGCTRPTSRRSGYENDRKPNPRIRCRPPPEELSCECESEETISSERKHRDNRPKSPSDDKGDTSCIGPKKRQDKEKGNREVFETCCTEDTCPYLPRRRHSQEPCASPNRKPTKCYDDEREAMNKCRNQSPARKIPRPRNDTSDCERPRKVCSTILRPKKKAATDVCECSSDDNISEQGKYSRYERSPRTDRNKSYKKNSRAQRGYPDTDYDCNNYTDDNSPKRGRKNMTNYSDDCECSSDSDEYTKYKKRDNPGGSRRKGDLNECDFKRPTGQSKRTEVYESECDCPSYTSQRYDKKPCPRDQEYKPKKSTGQSKGTNAYESECDCPSYTSQRYDKKPCPRNQEYKSKKSTGQSKRTDVYESECDCPSYTSKRYDKKPCPRNQEYKSKESDAHDSVYDCFCSSDHKKPRIERKPSPCSPHPRCKQRDQKKENSRLEKTVCRRKPSACQIKCPQTAENSSTKTAKSEENEIEFECECECKCNEENNMSNGELKPEDVCSCNCGPRSSPFEPLTQSSKRNPAGDGSTFDDSGAFEEALKHASDSASTSRQASYKLNPDLPFPEEPKSVQFPESSVSRSTKKKKPTSGSSKNSKSSKPKPTTASPTRNSAPPKTQPGETAKKRTASVSNGKRNAPGGAKRTTDRGLSAAANSKLPNDLNTASYFICTLQDDDNSQQYLIIVPKEPIERCDTHRDDPGQGSWKQLHCQRQFSGFQSMSWDNPASDSVFTSPPFHPNEGISEGSSYAMPPGMTGTTMRIVKEYLHQTMKARSPGLMKSFQPVFSPRSILKRILARPKRCHPVDRPSSKANAVVLSENQTALLTKNPLQNFSSGEDKKKVIVLLPPVLGFRPSKDCFNAGAMEVQRIQVRNSATDVRPRTAPTKTVPPRPPAKPKRKARL